MENDARGGNVVEFPLEPNFLRRIKSSKSNALSI